MRTDAETVTLEDLDRIISFLLESDHVLLTREEAHDMWLWHSHDHAAGWLFVPRGDRAGISKVYEAWIDSIDGALVLARALKAPLA